MKLYKHPDEIKTVLRTLHTFYFAFTYLRVVVVGFLQLIMFPVTDQRHKDNVDVCLCTSQLADRQVHTQVDRG